MPKLYVLRGPDKGRTFAEFSAPALLGRQSAHVALTDHAVSREHAILRSEGAGWIIEDLHSSNGTCVNGQHIDAPTRLKHGDQIKIGGTLLIFSGDDSVERFSGPAMTRGVVEYAVPAEGSTGVDSSILSAIPGNEDSVILATPETAHAVHAWKLMYQIAEAIATFTQVEDLLERITDLICEHLVFDRVMVFLRSPDGEEFWPQVVRCRSAKTGEQPKVTASQTLLDHVRTTRNGVLCADTLTDPRLAAEDEAGGRQNLGLRNILCVPIIAHDEVQGIIYLDCAMAQHTYTQEQLRLVTAIGRMAGMAIENSRLLQSRMQHERLAAMGETVAYLSHHIRNILQGLHGGSDILELGIKRHDLDTIVSAWKILQRNLDRTLHLATNMLTFSTDRQPAFEMVQLNQVVEDAVGLAQHHTEEKGVTLLSDYAEVPPVLLDKEGIHQAILNVLLNAIDASPATTGRVVVSTAYHADDGTAVVSLSDNGPGIEPEKLPYLFEPFHSTKGHRGTGLGLAAAKKVVRECGGEIEVETRPGAGATFRIVIPAGRTRILNGGKTVQL
ncbi:MAG: ATP-binding protein [Planctomycetota bacterium]